MRNITVFFILLLGSLLFASNSQCQETIVCKKITKSPVIDGKLDDGCWSIAEKTKKFRVLATENPKMLGQMLIAPKKFRNNASTVYLCYDDKNLYIGYINPAPKDMPILSKKHEHDSRDAWRGDCVELFIDPLRKKKFFQLAINASGYFADLECNPSKALEDWKWQSNAKVKTAKIKSGYSVEISIPFSSMGNPDRSVGTVWGANFTRQGKSCGGLSSWANVGRDFHSVDAFGYLIFGNRKEYHLKRLASLTKKVEAIEISSKKKEIDLIKKKILNFKKDISLDGNDPSEFNQLSEIFENIDNTIQNMAFKEKKYLFWEKDIWGALIPKEKVPIDTKELTVLNLFSPENTFNSTGFVISNLTSKPLMGRFVLDPNNSTNVTTLPKDNIEFYKALYIELKSGIMTPDALIKLPLLNIIEVPPRTSVLLWIEIDTHKLKQGKYERNITFVPSYSGYKKKKFKIELEVAPVDLEKAKLKQWTYIKNATSSSPAGAKVLARHGVNTIYTLLSQEAMYPVVDKNGNILKFDTSVYDKKISNMLNAGVKKEDLNFCFWLGFDLAGKSLSRNRKPQLRYGTSAWKKGFTNSIKAIRDYLFKQGFNYDDIVFYPIDEPYGDKDDPKSSTYKTFEGARFVKKADPKLKVMSNMRLGHKIKKEKMKDYLDAYIKEIDILTPYRPHLNKYPEQKKQLQDSGNEVWVYSILCKSTHPTVFRNLSWENFRDGFGSVTAYWAFDAFAGDPLNSNDANPRRPKVTWDYGTCYVNKNYDEYIPSRRLKAWYQGNQDYRALYLLKKKINSLKTQGKDVSSYQKKLDEIINKTVNGTSEDMQKAREKIIKIIRRINNENPS